MKIFKKIFFIIIFSSLINPCFAKDPSEFISEVTQTASNILKEDITLDEKAEKLIILAESSVDIDGIGLYSLGKHRKAINKEELNKYKIIFRKYFLKSFSSRLSQYSDPKINVVSHNTINEKYTIVSSILVETSERPEIKIDWRVYTINPTKPLIRDLIIEGLSLARTQKEEFNSVIQGADGDVNALFTNLENFTLK
tara:strand:- start:748 stop:1338 length:591 start_codon:yes stop_codon:yes gene_type:complete